MTREPRGMMREGKEGAGSREAGGAEPDEEEGTGEPPHAEEKGAGHPEGAVHPEGFRVAENWNDIDVIVAGGPGKHSCWLPTLGGTDTVSRRIETAKGDPVRSICS